ncbi:calcium-binding protein [Neisseria dentiae]|uniref:calcium-binding protein n=1 Tax=Neisseria dentiae TaxID=194197 RepID=UPI00211BC131|nr:calcium-binding protein [Neisseria dentiae]MCQ9326774.1 calcium-binding protein [Neisseria dentiae]
MDTNTVVVNGTPNDDVLYGSLGRTVIYGNGGNDTIYGLSGLDTMYGGEGNDTFHIAGSGDTIIEESGQGSDTVYSSVSYTAPRNVENLVLTGDARINGTGNNSDNTITGNDNYNRLNGGRGNDTIYGNGGEDTIDGGEGDDKLYGGADRDNIFGGAGNDLLDGGTGKDVMRGQTGDDVYHVDNVDDTVIEETGEGTDIIYSSVSYTASRNVENLVLTGDARINGTGNNSDNTITGNDNYNRLNGGRGNDTIYGNGGEDTIDGGEGDDKLYGGADRDNIFGGAGNDLLDGGTGKDVMRGQTGDDVYYVDNVDDTVIEEAGEGTDIIYSSVSYTASRNVENLVLTGSARINGTGNNSDNTITGNDNYNRLNGGRGNDTIYGNGGEDTIDGGEGDDNLYGGADRDHIFGGTGNDYIDGGTGNDLLRGQAGNDTYYFAQGYGHDVVRDTEGSNIVRFGSGITVDDITVREEGANWVITLKETGDTLTLENQTQAGEAAAEFVFDSGSVSSAALAETFGLVPAASGLVLNDDYLSVTFDYNNEGFAYFSVLDNDSTSSGNGLTLLNAEVVSGNAEIYFDEKGIGYWTNFEQAGDHEVVIEYTATDGIETGTAKVYLSAFNDFDSFYHPDYGYPDAYLYSGDLGSTTILPASTEGSVLTVHSANLPAAESSTAAVSDGLLESNGAQVLENGLAALSDGSQAVAGAGIGMADTAAYAANETVFYTEDTVQNAAVI